MIMHVKKPITNGTHFSAWGISIQLTLPFNNVDNKNMKARGINNHDMTLPCTGIKSNC